MIPFSVPAGLYPGLAHDGTMTFAGVLLSYFNEIDATGQNIGLSRNWSDVTAAKNILDYQNRILPIISHKLGNQKPMHTYTADDFEAVLSELKARYHYAESTVNHYRHLLWTVYRAGITRELYVDRLFWEEIEDTSDDPEKAEKHRIAAMTRTRKSFSIQEDIKLLLHFLSLDPQTASGEEIGLMLMYFLGLRNNEACGADYSAIHPMQNHPEEAVFDMVQTTIIGSNQLKSSGKTKNAPRTLPLPKWLFTFLETRKNWIRKEISAGHIALPDGIASVNQLPIACKNTQLTLRTQTTDLSRTGRSLFQKIGIEKSELAVLQKILFSEDFLQTQIEEKDPTTYLLRRNVATRLYHLGFDWKTIQYWIAHEIEDTLLKRNFFADEETLHDIAIKYTNHPIFAILEAESNRRCIESRSTLTTKCHTHEINPNRLYLVRARSSEPGKPISVSIHSSASISITQTDVPLNEPCKDTVEIDAALYDAYYTVYHKMKASISNPEQHI